MHCFSSTDWAQQEKQQTIFSAKRYVTSRLRGGCTMDKLVKGDADESMPTSNLTRKPTPLTYREGTETAPSRCRFPSWKIMCRDKEAAGGPLHRGDRASDCGAPYERIRVSCHV